MAEPAASVSRRAFLGTVGLTGAGALAATTAVAVNPEAAVIEQRPREGACAPCALGNALLHGDAAGRRAFAALPGAGALNRVDTIVARYGVRPSETYGKGRGRFLPGAGLPSEDMPFLTNDFLRDAGLPTARGQWLDSAGGEDQRAHLRRVHELLTAALARGLPPIVEVRAFCADPSRGAQPWVNLFAHWLALIEVDPGGLTPGASGFGVRFADSFTGRVINGFAYAERFRPFQATRGFEMGANGVKDWHWLSGHPYVLLTLPDVPLDLEGRPWHERAVVALTYAVFRG